MSVTPVPEDIRQFLLQHVQSIAQLEILLLVSASPDRWWTVKEVYKGLQSNEILVEKTLEDFTKNGLMQKSVTGTYQFSSPGETGKLAQSLAEIYRDRPAKVVQVIYETPLSDIEEFARAFKIRKEP